MEFIYGYISSTVCVLADRKFTERWFVAMSAKFTDQTECLIRLHPETEDEGAICDVARKF